MRGFSKLFSVCMFVWFFLSVPINALVSLQDTGQSNKHNHSSFQTSSLSQLWSFSIGIIIFEFSITQETWIFLMSIDISSSWLSSSKSWEDKHPWYLKQHSSLECHLTKKLTSERWLDLQENIKRINCFNRIARYNILSIFNDLYYP